MAKFDPQRHKVVAVPFQQDDPEKGQHFHVDLDELAAAASAEGGDGNPFLAKRIESIEARITKLANRVDDLESRPYVSDETLKQLDDGFNAKIKHMVERHVNAALGDLRSRMISVEKSSSTIVPKEAQSDQLAKLGAAVHSFGEYVARVENDLEDRVATVEQVCAEVSEHITETNLKTMQLSTRLYRALAALEHDDEAAA